MVAEAVQIPAVHTSRTGSAAEARRLAKAAQYADKALRGPRAVRRALAREYAGRLYGEGAEAGLTSPEPEDRVSINLLLSMVGSITPALSLKPQAEVTTEYEQLRHYAQVLKAAIDHDLEECGAEAVFGQAGMEALFGPAVLKTGICGDPAISVEDADGYRDNADKPYVSLVDLDDYLPDMTVRSRDMMGFEGNRFDVSFDWAMDSGAFDRAGRGEIERIFRDNEGRQEPHERTESIERRQPEPGRDECFIPRVQLAELWLPFSNRIVVMPADWDAATRFLADHEYAGPEGGPYDLLAYLTVPGCLMPLSKVGSIFDLHLLINLLARKIAEQAINQKTVGVHDGTDVAGLEAIQAAGNNQWARVANIDRFKEISLGGVNPLGPEAVTFFEQWFQRMAGNPNLVGGLQAESKTATQDQMLMQAASQVIASMRQAFLAAAKQVLTKLAWYRWSDPSSTFNVLIPVEDTPGFQSRWDPETREGDWLDYHIAISPYGVRFREPTEEYQALLEAFERLIVPLASMGAPVGDVFDGPAFATYMMDRLGVKDQGRFWRKAPPIMVPDINTPAAPRQNVNTNVSVRPAGSPARPVTQAPTARPTAPTLQELRA